MTSTADPSSTRGGAWARQNACEPGLIRKPIHVPAPFGALQLEDEGVDVVRVRREALRARRRQVCVAPSRATEESLQAGQHLRGCAQSMSWQGIQSDRALTKCAAEVARSPAVQVESCTIVL